MVASIPGIESALNFVVNAVSICYSLMFYCKGPDILYAYVVFSNVFDCKCYITTNFLLVSRS